MTRQSSIVCSDIKEDESTVKLQENSKIILKEQTKIYMRLSQIK